MEVLVKGLSFAEGPRWHNGALYFSDFYTHSVHRLDIDSSLHTVATVPKQPSGLGWLPDGRMLIVSMLDRKLLRLEADGSVVEHADLSAHASWHCNDMVVDGCGHAYVGNFGFDTHGDAPHQLANLIRVDPDGTVSTAAEGFDFPNGAVITPDGSTLVVGETRGKCLTAFSIDANGNLSDRRVWADLDPYVPDGICLDAEGYIWVADPRNGCLIRVAEGGTIAEKIDLDSGEYAYACALGGPDRKTLYVCAGTGSGEYAKARREAEIRSVSVEVAGVGWP